MKIFKNINFSVYIFILILSSLIAFLAGNSINNNNYKETMNGENENFYSDNECIKIIYRSKYILDDENIKYVVDREIMNTDKDILSKSQDEQIKFFTKEDYDFEKSENNELFYLRSRDKYRYQGNKYVIGIEGNYIVIYKTDDDGKLFIENPEEDVTDICVEDLPEDDIIYLEFGREEYQFNTKDEAEEGIRAFFES